MGLRVGLGPEHLCAFLSGLKGAAPCPLVTSPGLKGSMVRGKAQLGLWLTWEVGLVAPHS